MSKGTDLRRETLYRKLLMAENLKIKKNLESRGKSTEGCMDLLPSFDSIKNRRTIPNRVFKFLRDTKNYNSLMVHLGKPGYKRTNLNKGRMYLSLHLWDDLVNSGMTKDQMEALTASLIGVTDNIANTSVGKVYEWKAKHGV